MQILQWRQTLLPVVWLVPISVMLWFHVQDMSRQQRALEMLQVQKERKEMVKSACSEDEILQISSFSLKHLIVDDDHGLLYCYVPMAKLMHYTKYFFVGDPFNRLISAFQNKFGQPKELIYAKYGKHILQHYNNESNLPQTAVEAFESGKRVSFNNFIQFLLDPKTMQPFDPHWRQIQQLCHPCQIQYDFIGFQETLDEDAEQLLSILKLTKDFKFPHAYKNMTSSDSVLQWFSQVPLKDRRKLFMLYEKDFKLFGYRRPDELLDG
ncbi:carbohydrate sulfotransferase 12-like [Solea senegalensis]|uniref:Carbohydrate sulfotransferase n=1 Tax=Solea senegalensis TaxID=28829 RepID=A0AAV6QY82_SOLSE|nr:carbohydrate sulfotransferase 12-like [Solea senegalensis]